MKQTEGPESVTSAKWLCESVCKTSTCSLSTGNINQKYQNLLNAFMLHLNLINS